MQKETSSVFFSFDLLKRKTLFFLIFLHLNSSLVLLEGFLVASVRRMTSPNSMRNLSSSADMRWVSCSNLDSLSEEEGEGELDRKKTRSLHLEGERMPILKR